MNLTISNSTTKRLVCIAFSIWATQAVHANDSDHDTHMARQAAAGHAEAMDHSMHNMGSSAPAMDHSMHDMGSAAPAMDHSMHKMDDTTQAGGADPHAQHRAMMQQQDYQRSERQYPLGQELRLVEMTGRTSTLEQAVNADRPVMLNFIFTTCTTICPVMSATFTQVQQQLGSAAAELRMISITIDPEHDTPARLRDYAKRFQAGPQWSFYTGELGDIIAIQKAFDVYRGSKMSHEPTTLMRISEADPWIRIDGLASAGDIVREYQQLAGR